MTVTINVEGQASIKRLADEAVVAVTVSEESENQEAVASNVLSTVHDLQATFQRLQILPSATAQGNVAPALDDSSASSSPPLGTYTTKPLVTNSYIDYEMKGSKAKERRLHAARSGLRIQFRDFSRLGEIIATLSKWKLVTLDRISWQLTSETAKALQSRMRKESLRDAVAKATELAEVLGYSAVEAVEVDQPSGTRVKESSHNHHVVYRAASKRSIGASDAHLTTIDLEPEEISVEERVQVKFQAGL